MSDSSTTGLVPAAMSSPATSAIARRSPSIRRTSHIDMHVEGAEVELLGGARDLITTATGSRVAAEACLRASVDTNGALAALTIAPPSGNSDSLVGRQVAGGFRDAVHAAFPDDAARGTPLALLLDDLPVATLISGYARLYSGDVPADAAKAGMKSDICSGWRSQGTMMTSVRAGIGVPVTLGPTAPSLDADREFDAAGWHDIDPLPEGSMRRRRMIDIHLAGDRWEVNAMFRDTHVQPGGHETVLHEYALTANVDAASQMFLTCSAVPRVLPWVECPVAAASADRLVGHRVDEVRDYVRRELRGISTCTHLNDLLRSLGDIDRLGQTLTTAISNDGETS